MHGVALDDLIKVRDPREAVKADSKNSKSVSGLLLYRTPHTRPSPGLPFESANSLPSCQVKVGPRFLLLVVGWASVMVRGGGRKFLRAASLKAGTADGRQCSLKEK